MPRHLLAPVGAAGAPRPSAVTVFNALASGPLQSWATLEPLLVKAHVWEGADQLSKFQSAFSLALGVSMLSGLLNGVLFDVLGPRWVLTVGSFGLALCHLVMAFAVQNPAWNDQIWGGCPADCISSPG
ncbi:unnamed protein product [Prorocentrum cordatum]|uniref:Solute carrier family 40 protein n=1 Tax=Prorocentrum cordatum TaxID=2364126 RepID=A0ABN9YF91_9DINO|nr:unnamed protein product [Polarella glacialis]